ncbi:MAG: Spy/CpxP family protein refolding chaperone [Cyanobacteriota bacterium]
MDSKNITLILIITISFFSLPAYSQQQQTQQIQNVSLQQNLNNISKPSFNINWSELNLTAEQSVKINQLDEEWKRIQQVIRPRLVRDQQQLKNIMKNPDTDEDRIRKLQNDIMLRQKQLRYEATENFLSKRRVLTPEQREVLHKKIIP